MGQDLEYGEKLDEYGELELEKPGIRDRSRERAVL
jgi:hypothetical protein